MVTVHLSGIFALAQLRHCSVRQPEEMVAFGWSWCIGLSFFYDWF